MVFYFEILVFILPLRVLNRDDIIISHAKDKWYLYRTQVRIWKFINIYITKNATPSRTEFNTIKELTAEETTVVSKQTTALRLRRWNWNGVGTAAGYSNNLFQ